VAICAVLAVGLGACRSAEPETTAEEQQDLNQASEATPAPEWSLAIHGGAGSARRDTTDAEDYYQALRDVLSLGSEQLAAGEASLRVVEEVVAALEDDPRFNAGRGSVFTSIGTHELDAAIMDGRTLACGAVAGVKNVRNPVRLARRVMEDTPHVLLSGQGADNFAVNAGVRRNVQAYFTTEPQLERFRAIRSQRRGGNSGGDGAPSPEGDYTGNAGPEPGQGGASHLGTVGAVAMDRYGNLAAATSTGGTMYKQIGRVGDVPVIGAGTYANNETAAISCTGRGEEFIRHTVAYDVSALIEYAGLSVEEAVRQVIGETLKPGDGGIIAIGRNGSIAMEFNTNAMFRGAANSLGRFDVGIWEDVRSGRP
jgi:beta-aspartyl-peptidase (threonine type)